MANKFKQAAEQQRVAPGNEQKPPRRVEPTPPPVPEKITPENPLAGMIEPKPEGKSYGFYLSAEAAEKLEQLAKQNKCSKSKALDALLRSL